LTPGPRQKYFAVANAWRRLGPRRKYFAVANAWRRLGLILSQNVFDFDAWTKAKIFCHGNATANFICLGLKNGHHNFAMAMSWQIFFALDSKMDIIIFSLRIMMS